VKRSTPAERDNAVVLYRDGWSLRELVDEMGRSYGWVHTVISQAAREGLVVMRSRGGGPRI